MLFFRNLKSTITCYKAGANGSFISYNISSSFLYIRCKLEQRNMTRNFSSASLMSLCMSNLHPINKCVSSTFLPPNSSALFPFPNLLIWFLWGLSITYTFLYHALLILTKTETICHFSFLLYFLPVILFLFLFLSLFILHTYHLSYNPHSLFPFKVSSLILYDHFCLPHP